MNNEQNNSAQVVRDLNEIMFVEGYFFIEVASVTINRLLSEGIIDREEYLELLDAAKSFHKDGHYRNSIIYKRATQNQ